MKKDQISNTKKWDDVWKGIAGNKYPHEQLVKYVNIIKDFPVMKALDIGFGGGANLKFLVESGFKAYGIEVSENSLATVKKRGDGWNVPLELQLFTPPQIPFEDGSFGFVTSIEALYYTLDLETIVSEIYRVLAPGGRFYISFRTPTHGVVKEHARRIDNTLMEWKEDMPTREMAGVRFRCFEDKEDLFKLFNRFSDVRVDMLMTDLLGRRFELLIVTGKKKDA